MGGCGSRGLWVRGVGFRGLWVQGVLWRLIFLFHSCFTINKALVFTRKKSLGLHVENVTFFWHSMFFASGEEST